MPDATNDEYWGAILGGDTMPSLQRAFRRLPSPPRCKLCMAPFRGFGAVLRLIGYGRSALNPQLCRICLRGLEKRIGGAEVEVSLLFVDVRGSTPLAEKISPSEFTALLNRFYNVTGIAVDEHDGVIDHIAGDGVMAMWIPGFVGEQHAHKAVGAGVQLLESLEEEDLALSLPVGGGVHTGTAYVGSAGTDRGALDFTVLGDIPNTAARLGSAALAGELLVSRAAAHSAALAVEGLERRLLDLKGKAEPFEAWVVRKPVSV